MNLFQFFNCSCINLLVIWFSVSIVISEDVQHDRQYCTVETKNGRIRGKQNSTLFEQKLFYSFRGIPFAKPPIGDLRFKAPVANDPWTGTFDAFDFSNDCIQPNSEHNEYIIGSEDCLYLNVFVPRECAEIDSTIKLPVLFYIYGGRFIFGSAQHYAPDFFMKTDVIVVTFNYRLGPFGFLSLNSSEYSGNMAMKDQVQALKWVNENIGQFGGDMEKITVMGHSSGKIDAIKLGGVSAELLMISKQSKHLFQRAVMMSGSALNPWIPTRNEHSAIFYDLAQNLSHPVTNQEDLIKFLKQVDAKNLLSKTFRPEYVRITGRREFDRVWTIFIEPPNAVDPFLTESPFDILTNENHTNNIDALYSFSPKELTPHREQRLPKHLKEFDEVFEMDLPLEIARMDFNSQLYKNISQKIRDFYFNGKHLNADSLSNMSMLISDIVFLYGIDLSARINSAKSTGRTFVSQFSAENEWNFSAKRAKPTNYTINYSQHFDQLFYLFRLSMDPNLVSDADYRGLQENSLQRSIIKRTVGFYANFVKYGKPMPSSEMTEFKPAESRKLRNFDITNDGIYMKTLNRNRAKFWDGVFDDFKQYLNTSFNFHLLA